MTFMFEMPEYIKVLNFWGFSAILTQMSDYFTRFQVDLSEKTKAEFPHYNLYVYSEGSLADHLKVKQYDGIPVLFIPGNFYNVLWRISFPVWKDI